MRCTSVHEKSLVWESNLQEMFGELNAALKARHCKLKIEQFFNLQFPFLVAWLPLAGVGVLRRLVCRHHLKLVNHLCNAFRFFSDTLRLTLRLSGIDISTQGNRAFDHVDVDISLWRLRVTD